MTVWRWFLRLILGGARDPDSPERRRVLDASAADALHRVACGATVQPPMGP